MIINKDTVTLIAAFCGVGFGLIGSVLGVINLCRAISNDKVRVKVIPVSLLNENRKECGFGIRVMNLSKFPVTISNVGFTTDDPGGNMLTFEDIAGCNLPERLEPRTSFTAILPIRAGNEPWQGIRKAFASTDCGKMFTGTSQALRNKINNIPATRLKTISNAADDVQNP